MSQTWEYIARIVLRYGFGAIGITGGSRLASDPDAVALVALALSVAGGAAVEWWTGRARRAGRKV